ncbi:MAG: hypothetical protein AB8G95_26335 [Anaerolineae bacterium]
MQKFETYEQLLEIVEQIRDLPADDDRVTFDPLYEKTLEIRFNAQPGRTKTDEDGNERETYDRLLLRNVESFDVEVADDGRPHRIVDIEKMYEGTYRFVLTHARWIVKINGEPTGEFGEEIDDTDFELTFSNVALAGVGLAVVAVVVGLLRWLF